MNSIIHCIYFFHKIGIHAIIKLLNCLVVFRDTFQTHREEGEGASEEGEGASEEGEGASEERKHKVTKIPSLYTVQLPESHNERW